MKKEKVIYGNVEYGDFTITFCRDDYFFVDQDIFPSGALIVLKKLCEDGYSITAIKSIPPHSGGAFNGKAVKNVT